MKLIKLSNKLYKISIETPTFFDEKKVILRFLNKAKTGDKWFADIYLEVK